MTREEAKSWIKYHINISDYESDDELLEAFEMAIKALNGWIPVNEHEAMFPCLATDKFGQIFIPISVVTIGNRCYDGHNFRFDVGDFLKGEEIEVDGETMYLAQREIVAWMPLPEPWKGVKDGRTEKDPV